MGGISVGLVRGTFTPAGIACVVTTRAGTVLEQGVVFRVTGTISAPGTVVVKSDGAILGSAVVSSLTWYYDYTTSAPDVGMHNFTAVATATSDSSVATSAAVAFEVVIPAPDSLFDGGGVWNDLAASLVSSSASARTLTAVGSPATDATAIQGTHALKFTGTERLDLDALSTLFAGNKPVTVVARARPSQLGYLTIWGAAYTYDGSRVIGQSAVQFPILEDWTSGGTTDRVSTSDLTYEPRVIAWKYDGAGNTKIFVDGVLTTITNGTGQVFNGTLATTAYLDHFSIGCWFGAGAAQNPFYGWIQRYAIADAALTDAQVVAKSKLMANGNVILPYAVSPKMMHVGDSNYVGQDGQSWRGLFEQDIIANHISVNSIGSFAGGSFPNHGHSCEGGDDIGTAQARAVSDLNGTGGVKLLSLMIGTNEMDDHEGDPTLALAHYDACIRAMAVKNIAERGDQDFGFAVTTVLAILGSTPGHTTWPLFNAALPAIWDAFQADYPGITLLRWDIQQAIGTNVSYYVDSVVHLNPTGFGVAYNDATHGFKQAALPYLQSISPT